MTILESYVLQTRLFILKQEISILLIWKSLLISLMERAGDRMALLDDIEHLDKKEIVSDDLFLELFERKGKKEESEVTKARDECALLERAKEVGELEKFEKLLSAYQKDYNKYLKSKPVQYYPLSADYNIDPEILKKLNEEKPEEKYTLDDRGNGYLFADFYKDKCRFNTTSNEWYVYDGKIWKKDERAMQVNEYAKSLLNYLNIYAVSINDTDKQQTYRKHLIKLGNYGTRKNMLEDAKTKNCVSNEDFDKDIFLLNCQNCVIDLRTFETKEHNPNLLLSKIANVFYDESATCEEWERFLNEIMQGKKEKIDYLQKILGYSLTGDTREETCYILYGSTTRNGKSTLVETISEMLGGTKGYAMNMEPQTLALKHNHDSRTASGDIARLNGTRFLNASEPPKRMVFDIGLLKSLTGRDTITARHIYEREFEFIPNFKLFMNTNFLPLITDDTIFSSGRVNVITFDRHFTPKEQDKGLKDRLKTKDSLSGILNWCLTGLKKYKESGAKPPAPVVDATIKYRNDSDKVGNFMAERLEKSTENSKAKDIYDAYKRWCDDNGYGAENKGNFFSELRTKGILSNKGTIKGKTYSNIVRGYKISKDFETPFD